MAIGGDVAALEVAEVADVMDGVVAAFLDERGIAGVGEGGAFGEQGVKVHAGAGIGFAPDAEVAGEAVAEDGSRRLAGVDGEADGGGGAGVGGAADLGLEVLAKDAGDEGEFAAAAGDVDGFEGRGGGAEVVDGVEGFGDEGFAASVEVGHRDEDLGPGGADEIEIDGDAAGVGVERFFFAAGLFLEAEGFGLGEVFGGEAGFGEGFFGEEVVKIVAAEGGDAFAGDDVVGVAVEFDEGGVEGAAAQVVNEDGVLGGGFFAVAVAVFDGGGRGFVQQADDLEAGLAEGFDGEEALVGVGAGGDAEHDFELFAGGDLQVGVVAEGVMETGGEFGEDEREGGDETGDGDGGVGTGVTEETFQAADDGGGGIRLRGPGLPPVDAVAVGDTHERGVPFADFALGAFEGDNRVIPAIGHGDDDARGTEIDSQPHSARITGNRGRGYEYGEVR